MLLAVLFGALGGVAGFVPLAIALYLSRKYPSSGIGVTALASLGGVFFSFVVLGAAIFACSRIAHDYVLPFGLVQIFLFIIVSVVYFLWHNRLIRQPSESESKGE